MEVATGQEHALIRTSKNRLVSWRKDPGDQLLKPPQEVLDAKVRAVSAYRRLGMALTEGGHAYAWGVGVSTQGGPLLISEPKVAAIAAGHYAFLGKADAVRQDAVQPEAVRFLAGDRPGGAPSDVNAVFPGDSLVTGKSYVLKNVGFGTPVQGPCVGGASPTLLALAPATDADVTLQEGYVYPAAVRPGSDLAFQWRVDNDGPAKATGIQLTVQLPTGTTLHPKHKSAVDKGAIVDLGGGRYRFKTVDLEPQEDGWTVPLMTRTAADAKGELTATAEVTAGNIADPTPPLSVAAQVRDDGDKWESDDDSDLWEDIGKALLGGLFALFKLFSLPGGGNSSQSKKNNRKPKRKKPKNKFTTLRLDASADVDKPAAGSGVVMTWTLKNTGGKNKAKSPAVTVIVPSGLTITKAKPAKGAKGSAKTSAKASAKGSAKVLGKRSVLFRPGSLGPDKEAKVEITVQVSDDPPASLTVTGTAVAGNAVAVPHKLTVKPRRKTALRLPRGKATPERLQPGKDVAFEWALTNDGPSPARKTKLRVTLPKGLEHVTLTADAKPLAYTREIPSRMAADVPDLAKGATLKLAVRGRTPKDLIGDLTTTVEITADDAGKAVRDSVTATLRTTLELTGKIVGKVAANAYGTYVWTVRNTTDVDATDVRLSMTAPPSEQVLLHSSAPQTTEANGELLWKLGTLKGKSTAVAIVTYQIRPDQGGRRLGPTAATVRAANANDAPVGEKPRAEITERPALIARPVLYGVPVVIGKQAEFSWSLSNEGGDASDVKIVVDVPKELTGPKVTSPSGTADGNTVTFSRVPAGTVYPEAVTVTGTLDAPRPGAVGVQAEVSYQGRTLAGVACHRMAVSGASLAVTAAAGNPATVDAGAPATLTWTVSRVAPGPLQGTFLVVDVPNKVVVTALAVDGHEVHVRDDGRHLVPVDPASAKPVTVQVSWRADDDLGAGPVTFTAAPVWEGEPERVRTAPVTVEITRKAVLGVLPQPSLPDPVVAGTDAQLVWDVDNSAGPSSCSALTLSVPALDGCTLLSATAGTVPAGFQIIDDHPKRWVIDVARVLGAGHATQVTAKVAVAADAAVGARSATATVSGQNPDATRTATGSVTVGRVAQVTPTPTGAPTTCTAGDQVSYLWSLVNDGPSDASVAFTVTVRGENTQVTVPPGQAIGAEITARPAATELTWKPTAPLPPGASHILAFIAQTNQVPGRITLTTHLTVNGQPTTQPDAFHTTVTARPAAE
ncbi:conserved repeat domain-containing protein [Streptomyces sp. yr375]|uniref:DUF11 domain-containing protein n=1 Tax=Streptomyces sp. yr375 TaxID=1761906 RepID=UPI0008D06BCD|nr:DUF11 domain-containing protein [Streptomyces sp. yr375]SES44853.1 conserved repeat domain-containing protein [Streptomyces sp. yr375]